MSSRLLTILAAGFLSVSALTDILTSPSHANTQSRSEEEIEEIVRNYLLENPEIIFEAARRYQQQQAEAEQLEIEAAEMAAAEMLDEFRNTQAGHVVKATSGTADVILVEFFDYNCGVCRMAADFVFELQENDPDLEVVLQELPVFDPRSRGPALASLAIAGTDNYVAYHRSLLGSTGVIDSNRAKALAADLDIDSDLIEAALTETALQADLHARLDRSIDIGDQLGLRGTPAFLVASPDGSFLRLVPGFDENMIKDAIRDARS